MDIFIRKERRVGKETKEGLVWASSGGIFVCVREVGRKRKTRVLSCRLPLLPLGRSEEVPSA